jgi:mono/diheme cytochrome c family protein
MIRRLLPLLLIGSAPYVLGCKVGPAGKLESSVMTSAKHSIFIRNKKLKNPLPETAANIAAGKEAFSHYCVACHGMDGQNTGVPFAERMSPSVPPLIAKSVQSYTDGQLKWVIENGIAPSGMPSSKGILSDDEIWSTVLFIRHLPPAGSVGEPEMYSK